MKTALLFTTLLTPLLFASCTTPGANNQEKHARETLLFEDSMAENWQKNWFLDGEKATLEHRDDGLAFITEYTVNKRVDRAGFDAQHAVLWTRESFEGDIRITYKYTKLPGCSWQKLIYVQAQGIGEGPFVQDIDAWRDERKVPVMSDYFGRMDLIGLSLRDQIRCKRYPWNDMEGNDLEDEFLPRAENKGMKIGHELDVLVEKRKESILLRITDTTTGENVVDHIWDLSDERVLKNRNPKYIESGRIGIRQMGGHKILMRDFKVERL